jgi:TolB-like protein/Tfp pilus assembly protein PilF
VVLHHMAAGERPFVGRTGVDLASAILRDPPRPLQANVPPPLAAVIKRCLAKDPATRYASMEEVRAALEVAGQPEHAQSGAPGRASIASRPATWMIAVAATVVAAIAAIVVWNTRATPPATTRVDRVAVLPFDNLSGDPAQAFFSEGMTDEITTSLARTGSVTVISRTSALVFKDHATPLTEIGRRLGVQAVVEGSVLKVGDRVRITVRLVDIASDRHLWADSIERDYRDVLALQSDVARAVAQHVRAELTPEDTSRPPPARVNPAAYEKYLLGRHLMQQRNAEASTESVRLLEQAAALDPASAIIQAALAGAYREYDSWAGVLIGSSAEKIRSAAGRAIALDDQLPEAHFALAQLLYWYDWNWTGAEREFQAALAANPSFAEAHMGQALLRQTLGDDQGAVEAARRATALEPLSPTNLSDLGRILYRARRYREAVEQFTTALQLDAGFVTALYRLGDTQLMLGDLDGHRRTVARLEAAGAKEPEQTRLTLRAIALTRDGRHAEARALARRIEAASHGERPGEYAFTLSTLYALLGDAKASLDWLETGIGKRAMYPLQLRDPQLTLVQREPRYQELLRRLGMTGGT